MRFKQLLIDKSVSEYHITRLVQAHSQYDHAVWIEPEEATAILAGDSGESRLLPDAKRTLLVTRNPGSFFKPMGKDPQVTDCQRSTAVRLELFQGCPLDCVYCFCQQYLSCHHTVVFANIEDACQESGLETIHGGHTETTLVTGDIADSFALSELSVLIHEYAATLFSSVRFELRTKFQLPANYQNLDPARFRLDWSLSPEETWRLNEHGTANPDTRIESICQAIQSGFRVGIRLDPLQYTNSEFSGHCFNTYEKLLTTLAHALKERSPERFLVGSYKLSTELKTMIRSRFPTSQIPALEWVSCPDGKLRPFRSHRLRSYRQVLALIDRIFPGIPATLSMEFSYLLNLLDFRCLQSNRTS